MIRLSLREAPFYDVIIDIIIDYEIIMLMAHKSRNVFIGHVAPKAMLTLSRAVNLSLLQKNEVSDQMFTNTAYNLHLIDKEQFIRTPNIAEVSKNREIFYILLNLILRLL